MSMRWWGTRARTSVVTLAVPMSRPRYTCAESTLTISMGAVSARRSAQSVLPAPVGPVRTQTGSAPGAAGTSANTSAAPQEQLVELLQGQARPGRPAVVALVGALG